MKSQTVGVRRRIAGRCSLHAVCLWGMAASLACSDPDSSITRSTDDGDFALTLKAKKNWLRPGDVLPVQVRLKSLRGELEETLSGRIELSANVGRLDVDYLDFTFTGTSDTLATEHETVFADWIEFASFSSTDEIEQGELHAIYEDLQVTLKIRFVAAK